VASPGWRRRRARSEGGGQRCLRASPFRAMKRSSDPVVASSARASAVSSTNRSTSSTARALASGLRRQTALRQSRSGGPMSAHPARSKRRPRPMCRAQRQAAVKTSSSLRRAGPPVRDSSPRRPRGLGRPQRVATGSNGSQVAEPFPQPCSLRAVAVFLVTAVVVSELAARSRRRARESAVLAQVAGSLLERVGGSPGAPAGSASSRQGLSAVELGSQLGG
jgi:hypothetical protein